MAPPAATKPKRKRQRRRKEESSSESGSSSDDSSSEDDAPIPAPVPLASTSANDSDSSSEASSSSDESSDEEDGRGRRGNGPNIMSSSAQNQASSSANAAPAGRRPYPSRSPSPATFNPANLPLGQSPFPLLKALPSGPILDGFVLGDAGFAGEAAETEQEGAEKSAQAEKEEKFGGWWRARLVGEFESELGGLAAEPGLTAPRLALLLTSLTTLSTLHTTSSSLAASTKSIWLHDPTAIIDPLAGLAVEEGEDWGKATVGGEGDVEVGAEGVGMDAEQASAMEVDA